MGTKINEQIINYFWNHSSTICITFDNEGVIKQANVFAEKITGKTLVNTNIESVFVTFNRSLIIPELLQHPDAKKLINIETIFNTPSSYLFQFIAVDGLVLSIGEANSMENETISKNLLDLNNEFSNLTRELHKKNAELKKLNDLKNHFLGVAAHDLRNPLGYIMSYSDFLLEQLTDKITVGQLKMLNTIKSSSEFLLHLLDELLDISAIESGKLILHLEKTNIIELIRQNVELNKIISSKKNIQLFLDCTGNFEEILIDRIKIEQVLNNLISNAIKFSMPETRISISIFKTIQHITVAVSDEGLGIPANEIEKVFKPFEKTSVQATNKEKSTGLGLAIVWNIIHGHGGKIWVESKFGVGTTFFFSLPVNHNSANLIQPIIK